MSPVSSLVRFGYARGLFVLVFLLVSNAITMAESVRLPREMGEGQRLHTRLLLEALHRGATYSPEYPFGNPESLPLSTRIQGLRNNELDVFSAMTNKEYEKEFLAVYVPLYRGMMGMRLGIVKKSNANIFLDVESLADLKRFKAGQGKLWADSEILEANNIPLVRELKYSNLFRMLEAERFDYFPRGIHEPWQEIDMNRDLDLVVDPHIMLWYIAPFYIFVNKNKRSLADHLSEQLHLLVKDGTFKALFESDENVRKALELADLDKRKVIRLENPFLPPNTPINNKELWFDPMSYKQNIYSERTDL